MKPAQPLALSPKRSLIDPPASPGGEQGPALRTLVPGPAPDDAPWTSRLPPPAWQPFQVAIKVGGTGAPRGNGGRPDVRTDGGSRAGGRASGDPRSHAPSLPVSPSAVEAAANRPADVRPDARPEATREEGWLALSGRIKSKKLSKEESADAKGAVKLMEALVKDSAKKHKKKPTEGFKPPEPHKDMTTSTRGTDLTAVRQLPAPPKPADTPVRADDSALKALTAKTEAANAAVRKLQDLLNKVEDQKESRSPFLPSTGIKIPGSPD